MDRGVVGAQSHHGITQSKMARAPFFPGLIGLHEKGILFLTPTIILILFTYFGSCPLLLHHPWHFHTPECPHSPWCLQPTGIF